MRGFSLNSELWPLRADRKVALAGLQTEAVCSKDSSSPQSFVYVLGSVDIRFPDQSIADELQAVADQKRLKLGSALPLRSWYSKVLEGQQGRYVARLVSWILKVEGYPAYYLTLPDMADLDMLIKCLGQPEDDLDLVVGYSYLVPTELCPGVSAPVLAVNRVSSFDKRCAEGLAQSKNESYRPRDHIGGRGEVVPDPRSERGQLRGHRPMASVEFSGCSLQTAL
jgi:PatG Domain